LSAGALGPARPRGDHHRLEDFDCGIESLDRWLQRSARVAAASGTATTYVLCRRENVVVGYYALAMSAVWHEHASCWVMPDPVPVARLADVAQSL
jgi:hypothetical protein